MQTTLASYRSITRDLQQSLELTRTQPSVSLETQNFLDKIGGIKTIDDFLADTRVFRYAMKAFGLEDMAHAKGMMRKILEEGVQQADSFANRLADDRFLNFAQTFNFERDGDIATQTTAAQTGTVDRYVRQTLELDAGQENEGVRLALYFLREAPKVTSAYGLLADLALREVITTVLGLPDEMVAADIDKQANAILARMDIADLQDPTKLDALLTRFAATWDAVNTQFQDPVISLFGLSDPSASIDLDLVMTLKNLKHGGV